MSGTAEVMRVSGPDGSLAICTVTSGRLNRGEAVSIVRQGKRHFRGPISSLSVNRNAVEFVDAGHECTVMISSATFEVGDTLKAGR